jgi:hypothetical protein
MRTIRDVKEEFLQKVITIIEQVNLGNNNGINQYTCELIKQKIMKDLMDKKYVIKYRQPERKD